MRDESDQPGDDEEDAVAAVHHVEPVWAIVANVAEERGYGPGGAETRRGLRKLRPNAKVYVIGGFDGLDFATVVGRARGDNRYLTIHVPTRHLRKFRVQLVYSPHVIRQIRYAEQRVWFDYHDKDRGFQGGTEACRQNLERIVDALWWRLDVIRAHLVGGPHDGTVRMLPSDQVAPTLSVDDPDGGAVTYELADFDGIRARYRLRVSSAG